MSSKIRQQDTESVGTDAELTRGQIRIGSNN